MNPKISIIVPIYNVENYLEKCIDSIVAQSFKDFELILVNDGSTDQSGEICEKYAEKDNRITVIHQENKGVSAARNTGINRAKGEYIGFVDPDDDIEPDMYKELYEQAHINNADMVVSSIKTINDKTKETKISSVWEKVNCSIDKKEIENDIIPSILNSRYYSLLSCCNKLYKRKWFSEYGYTFDEKRHHGEDARLNLLLLQEIQSIVFLKEPFYNYYVRHNNSLTQTFRADFYEYFLDIKDFGVSLCEKYHLPQFTKEKIINQFVLNTLNYMQVVSSYEISHTEKCTILANIMADAEFKKCLRVGSYPSFYYRLLKLICMKNKEQIFIKVVKLKQALKALRKIGLNSAT